MSVITMCVNQIVRPKTHVILPGTGNCTTCVPDENNKKCKNYYPVIVIVEGTEDK